MMMMMCNDLMCT